MMVNASDVVARTTGEEKIADNYGGRIVALATYPSRKSYPRVVMMHPNRIGVVMMVPGPWTARRNGASFRKAKCVRV
jgi:hypothetical protein